MEQRKVISLPVTLCNYDAFVESLFTIASTRLSSYVCFANVHMIIESHRDQSFQNLVSNADLVAADGKPLSILLRLFHKIKQDRISGPDVFIDLIKKCETNNKSVFFYGSTEAVLQKLIAKLEREFPRLQIKGKICPPFRDLTPAENETAIRSINSVNPDFLFVALGCPRQERWMASQKNTIHSCMLGVGQAFNIYAGTLRRAPQWLQNLGLEWGFRLMMEPRRLWKRYLVTNSIFLFLVIKKSLGIH